MMRMNMMTVALAAAGLLLAGWAGAQVSDVSGNVALDTRSHSAVANVTDQDLDTRTYTEEWSAARKLNTKKIIGTLILMR
jgi:hypothetical protein